MLVTTTASASYHASLIVDLTSMESLSQQQQRASSKHELDTEIESNGNHVVAT
jgi:hypothetical protein